MEREDLLGVWRLAGITRGGTEVLTSQTHLVVLEDQLWEVAPGATYYEGERGPERDYRFEAGDVGRLEVVVASGCFCYLVQRDGDALRMRLGNVFGNFPKSIDGPSGNLSVFTREDPETADRLRTPPPRVKRRTIEHAGLGSLVYNDNTKSWRVKAALGQRDDVDVEVSVQPQDATGEAFDKAASIISKLDCDALKAYAASKLLEIHNDGWRDEEEDGPAKDAVTFASRLSVKTLSIETDGSASVWFADGDLFWGHSVFVQLDALLNPTDAGIAG